jgi:hypothetical protein
MNLTQAPPTPSENEAEATPAADRETPAEQAAAADAATATSDPWAPLLAAGAQLLGEMAAASKGERESPLVKTDPATGERYLKLPVPDPQTVQRLAEGLLSLLGNRK